jgi:hypothetical protein
MNDLEGARPHGRRVTRIGRLPDPPSVAVSGRSSTPASRSLPPEAFHHQLTRALGAVAWHRVMV